MKRNGKTAAPHRTVRIAKIACVYLSGVIGAGFVTGREIQSYFGRFGIYGLLGAAAASLLFFVTAYRLMQLIEEEDCKTMADVTGALFGTGFGRFVCAANAAFLYCMYIVILAGAGELLSSLTGLGRFAAMLAISAVCGVLLRMGFRGIALFCAVAAPVAAVVMAAAALLFLPADPHFSAGSEFPAGHIFWIVSAAVYVGYNLLLLISVMPRIRSDIQTEKEAVSGGLCGALAVCGLLFTVLCGLLLSGGAVRGNSMPLAALAARGGGWFAAVMYVVVLVTMILSAVTDLSGSAQFFGEYLHLREFTVCIPLLIAGGAVSLAGFGFLMDLFYTFFGILGVILIFLLVFRRKSR